MANLPKNASAADTRAQPVGGTALHGSIEAIGIHDLLRIAVTKGSTGRLLVFNDQTDAELYYEQGHLVAVTSSNAAGPEQLSIVLEMTEGEFEFARSLQVAQEKCDPSLHDCMMQAIKEHYQRRVRDKQEGPSHPAPMPRMSGVHRVAPSQAVTVSPIVNLEQPSPSVSASPAPSIPTMPIDSPVQPSSASPSAAATATDSRLAAGELGRAISDLTGRTTSKTGAITSQETALAALVQKQAQLMATLLGMRGLERFEIQGTNAQALLCRTAKDKLFVSRVAADADVDTIWRQLGL